MRFSTLVFAAWAMTTLAIHAGAADPVTEAKSFFATFTAGMNSFDPAVADLYADDAKIENTRKYPDGTKKTATVPAPKYKEMLRASMPAAKARRDSSDFFSVEYTPVGEKVRITATQLSHATVESTPLTLVVGAGADGKWKILEEISESRAAPRE